MKTNIVETGIVIEKDGSTARVLLGKGQSCKGCGMAKMGLCRPGGANMIFTVEDNPEARVGDKVILGLRKDVHRKGYFIAYILPLIAFVISALAGYMISAHTGLQGLEVITGFIGLALSILYSLKRLQKMDQTERMHIRQVLREAMQSEEAGLSPEGIDYLEHVQREHGMPLADLGERI
jgi:positive regulator of sigma E activity